MHGLKYRRYLGVYFSKRWELLKAVLTTVLLVSNRSFNEIYDGLDRCASPEVTVHLLSSKCMPVLLYGLDSCPTNATDLRSLKHPVTMAFMKIFSTNSIDIVSYCQSATVREQVFRHKIFF